MLFAFLGRAALYKLLGMHLEKGKPRARGCRAAFFRQSIGFIYSALFVLNCPVLLGIAWTEFSKISGLTQYACGVLGLISLAQFLCFHIYLGGRDGVRTGIAVKIAFGLADFRRAMCVVLFAAAVLSGAELEKFPWVWLGDGRWFVQGLFYDTVIYDIVRIAYSESTKDSAFKYLADQRKEVYGPRPGSAPASNHSQGSGSSQANATPQQPAPINQQFTTPHAQAIRPNPPGTVSRSNSGTRTPASGQNRVTSPYNGNRPASGPLRSPALNNYTASP